MSPSEPAAKINALIFIFDNAAEKSGFAFHYEATFARAVSWRLYLDETL